MPLLSRLLAALVLAAPALALVAFTASAQQAAVPLPKAFAHAGVAKDAERYESWIKANVKAPPAKAKAREVRLEAAKVLAAGTDPRAAARAFIQAVAADPADVEAWLGLSRALLAIKPDPNLGSERYELPLNASAAAYIGYLRSAAPPQRARALAVLADTLKRRSYWRPAIEALAASLAIAENAELRESYDALVAEHGFRLADYKVDNEAATPRLCLQFSEPLARGQIDFSKFLSIGARDPQGVSVEGKQLCIDGLVHGQRYEVQLRAGLPADNGEVLRKASEIAVTVKDRAAQVRFAGRSYVLPSRGQQGIPVVSINTTRVAIEVYRIGDRGLAAALASGDLQRQLTDSDVEALRERTGVKVYTGTLEVAVKPNEEVTTAVPVGEAIGALKPGVYAMLASPEGKKASYGELATQWFIVSDLGLTAMSGDSGIHAFVRSLGTAEPVAGAAVRLVARNNEVLGQGATDAAGHVRFEAGLKRGEGGLAPAILVAEAGGSDYAFLDLTQQAFDLADRGVKGRDAPGPLDAYLYAERGVYRPGESVHLTALVRDSAGRASTLPATLVVSRPDGVEHRRFTLTDQGLGGRGLVLALPGGAMTGTWRAKLHADPKADALAQLAFLVEDFVPERLALDIAPTAKAVLPDEPATLAIAGRYLYGPPAAGLALEGDIVVRASAKEVEGYPGYRFGAADEKITPVRKALEGLPSTGADGKASVTVALPAITRTPRLLEADVILRLREAGGRTIERTITLPVDQRMARVGIKPLFKELTVGEGEEAAFEAIALGADGKPLAGDLAWTLYRLEHSWQWYSRDGSWQYEQQTHARKAASGTAKAAAVAPARIGVRTEWGRYRLEIAGGPAGTAPASIVFSAGWHASDSAESPEMLDVALDKAAYKAGETARLRITSRLPGKALVSVLGNGLLAHQQIDVPRGGAEVAIPVSADWGPGAYATAMLYRPTDAAARRMPGRALGIKWIGIDQSARTLKVSLSAPEKVKSAAKLTVPVRIEGLASGEEARITLAAVDAGILSLTRYKDPAPEGWFHQQRRLATDIRDFYGRLIDGMSAERGRLRSGGDAGGGMSMTGSPPVEQLVALHSGIVKVGGDGTASVDFQLPDFNGAVRLMAVAWSSDKLGSAAREVIVRDAVALTASGPRFMTLGDEARLQLDVHNVDGPKAGYKVVVESESPAGAVATVAARDLALDSGQRVRESLALKPAEVGRAAYAVRVTGPDGIDVRRRLSFDVKVPAGDIRRVSVARLAPGGGKLTLSSDLLTDLIPGRTRINLSVGPTAAMDVPGLLTQLDRYPYGCAEQTVSRALPLLYANALAADLGLARDGELKGRVQGAVERVFEMQDASGAFGVWGPRNGELWLTAYVADFLTRAKETGYTVKPQGLAAALDRLQNYVSYVQDFESGGETRAYALYVLARNGRAPIGELRYYADTRLDRFSTPLAQAQLGAALAMLGDRERAEKAFAAAARKLEAKSDAALRTDYGSSLRDGAALVTLAAETRIARSETPRLAGVLAAAFKGRTYTSTQEQAWMLLAARALNEEARDTALTVNGAAHKGPLMRALSPAELRGGTLTIANAGEAAVDAVVSVIGAALTPEPAIAKGFTLTRSAYTLDGKPFDLKSLAGGTATLAQNQRLVMVVKLEAKDAGGRVLLVDRLPAGLEIENPRLVDGGDIKSLDWLKPTVRPEHTEFRDDRFVAAFNLFAKKGGQANGADGDGDAEEESTDGDATAAQGAGKTPASTATVAYIVRAVTPGSFVHPAATVEDMYRPERFARTAAGRLEVTAQR